MEYILIGCALFAGCLAGWFFARAQYSGELKAAGRTIADLRALEERLRAELTETTRIIEQERIEQARLQTRLAEAQLSLAEQKAMLDSASSQLTET
ncbi:MAG TPA: hypothetical protein PLU54_07125, partial [Deltaproteobacteria bacterium]|nr:hypothetical protein [Deltaproteobacteria bacterium]